MELYGSSGLKIGNYLLIKRDIYRGFLGKNNVSLKSLLGSVLRVTRIDKEHNKIELDVPGNIPVEIPYKTWKDYAEKFDKISVSNWRTFFGVK